MNQNSTKPIDDDDQLTLAEPALEPIPQFRATATLGEFLKELD